MDELSLKYVPDVPRDRRVTYGARMTQVRIESALLYDKITIAQTLKTLNDKDKAFIKYPYGGPPGPNANGFFQSAAT